MNAQKYSVEVYEDYVMIRGWVTVDFLTMIIDHFAKDGFAHLTQADEPGFKIVRHPALIRQSWMRKETVLHAGDCDCKECKEKWEKHENI